MLMFAWRPRALLPIIVVVGLLDAASASAWRNLGRADKRSPTRWASAGAVVFRPAKRSGEIEVLLVRSKKERREGTNGWTLPKGVVKGKQSKRKAAKVEVRQEGGVRGEIVGKLGVYGTRYAKRYYYLMRFKEKRGKPDHEILDTGWFSLKAALKKVERRRDRKVLSQAHAQFSAEQRQKKSNR